jgi:hypothetical protein
LDAFGFNEEVTSVQRVARMLVQTDMLSVETVSDLIKRMFKTAPAGGTERVATHILQAACEMNKMTPEVISIVKQSVLQDEHLVHKLMGDLEEYRVDILNRLVADESIRALMPAETSLDLLLPTDDELTSPEHPVPEHHQTEDDIDTFYFSNTLAQLRDKKNLSTSEDDSEALDAI